MTILERLGISSPRREADAPGPATSRSTDAGQLPIPGYDQLGDREVCDGLSELSQVELSAVEAYERAHADRPEVLDKLRYMITTEPLPGYDTLSPEEIAGALAGADSEVVRNVRDYERKFRRRAQVMDETARVLPTAEPSAREAQDKEDKATLLREGFEGRAETVAKFGA
ncbi:MAG: hypothetical protein QOI98_2460 [Solirubrobacteraceae bacterium]|jgi:hypothetical protein|nr:hypothetical protein [Solirubrobacteraceae bacterium]